MAGSFNNLGPMDLSYKGQLAALDQQARQQAIAEELDRERLALEQEAFAAGRSDASFQQGMQRQQFNAARGDAAFQQDMAGRSFDASRSDAAFDQQARQRQMDLADALGLSQMDEAKSRMQLSERADQRADENQSFTQGIQQKRLAMEKRMNDLEARAQQLGLDWSIEDRKDAKLTDAQNNAVAEIEPEFTRVMDEGMSAFEYLKSNGTPQEQEEINNIMRAAQDALKTVKRGAGGDARAQQEAFAQAREALQGALSKTADLMANHPRYNERRREQFATFKERLSEEAQKMGLMQLFEQLMAALREEKQMRIKWAGDDNLTLSQEAERYKEEADRLDSVLQEVYGVSAVYRPDTR